jgi:hypothetical protein
MRKGLLLLVAGLGCSCGSVSADEACASWTTAYCERINSCMPVAIVVAFGDVATCVTRSRLTCPPVFDVAGSSLTPQGLDDCAKALPAASCEELISHNPPAACRPKPGTLVNGTACGIDNQCQSGYCKTNGLCGVCSGRATAGGSCEQQDDCDYGLYCASKLCVAPAGPGATCDQGHPCRTDLSCVGGTCATPLAPGAKCDPLKAECEEAKGYFCTPKSQVCAAAKQAKAGEACGVLEDGYGACVSGGFCKMAGLSGSCVAAAADGATCSDTAGPHCQSPATCVNGLCKLDDPSTCK